MDITRQKPRRSLRRNTRETVGHCERILKFLRDQKRFVDVFEIMRGTQIQRMQALNALSKLCNSQWWKMMDKERVMIEKKIVGTNKFWRVQPKRGRPKREEEQDV